MPHASKDVKDPEAYPVRRVSVIGRAGSGKTTYALWLSRALRVPVVHLDALYWTPDWREVDRDAFEERQLEAIAGPTWVIDGGYLSSRGWPARAASSDVIVIAHAPLAVCLWRILRRALDRAAPRPDRPAGGGEQVSLYFLWWTASWGWRHRGLRQRLLAAGHHVVVARRLSDLVPLVAGLKPDHDLGIGPPTR